jgi:hypothetical protein
VTQQTQQIAGELERLSDEVAALLARASAAARAEWDKTRGLFPSAADLEAGFVAASQEELEQLRFKIRRFVEILAGVVDANSAGLAVA